MRKLKNLEAQGIAGGFTYTDTCGIDGCQFTASANYYEVISFGLAALRVMQAIGEHRRKYHPLKDRQ